MPARKKPQLLYIARAWPNRSVGGTPMRMAMTVEALAADYDVHFLTVASSREYRLFPKTEWVDRICTSTTEVHLRGRIDPAWKAARRRKLGTGNRAAFPTPLPYFSRGAMPPVVRQIERRYARVRFDAMLVARLHMAPYVLPFLRDPDKLVGLRMLDLDDIESVTRRRILRLYRAAGMHDLAECFAMDGERYEVMEREYLPLFHQVWVCSQLDAEKLRKMHPHEGVVAIPNAVRVPSKPPVRRPGGPFTILFIGIYGYYPNFDAVKWFCQQVLPKIRAAGRQVRVLLAGRSRGTEILELEQIPEVTVLGEVPTVGPCYRRSDLAIVPLRAGGGTRLKILEAFAHGRPVVSTTIGAEGLDVRHGKELLIADSADDFAARCMEIMDRPDQAQEMAGRALRWVREHHTKDSVLAAIREARQSMMDRPAVSTSRPPPSSSAPRRQSAARTVDRTSGD